MNAGVALGGYAMQLVSGKPECEQAQLLKSQLDQCQYGYRYE
jgi:hypothetical protein